MTQTWRVDVRDGVSLIEGVLSTIQAWGNLTQISRWAIEHANADGRVVRFPTGRLVHGLTLRSLREHGIVDEYGMLTEAGRKLREYGKRKAALAGGTADAFETPHEVKR